MSTITNNEYEAGYADGLGDGTRDAKDMLAQMKQLVSDFNDTATDVSHNLGVKSAQTAKAQIGTQKQKDDLFALNFLNIITAVPYAMYQAWVLSKLWGWFVLSNFHNAPHLTMIDFMGLMVLFGVVMAGTLLTLYNGDSNKTPQQKLDAAAARLIGWPVLISLGLGFGFIYHLFM